MVNPVGNKSINYGEIAASKPTRVSSRLNPTEQTSGELLNDILNDFEVIDHATNPHIIQGEVAKIRQQEAVLRQLPSDQLNESAYDLLQDEVLPAVQKGTQSAASYANSPNRHNYQKLQRDMASLQKVAAQFSNVLGKESV